MAQQDDWLVVEAITEIAVRNSAGVVIRPGYTFCAWEENDSQANVDVAGGSRTPIALKIPTRRVNSYKIPGLKITGPCSYPADYPRIATCRLVGMLQGAPANTPAIVSQSWAISLPVTNPPSNTVLRIGLNGPTNSTAPGATGFEMTAIVTQKPCPVPFRLSGNFQWHIECVDPPNINPLLHPRLTRLEFVWLCGPAPVGYGLRALATDSTNLDLDGVYPINLLRLFLPQPTDLLTLITFEDSGANFRDWWIQQALARVPSDRFCYNTISGKSGFGVGCSGGSFALRDFTRHALTATNFSPNSQLQSFVSPGASFQPILINSFDLAALTQLAYGLLVNSKGVETQQSRWVCKTPFGKQTRSIPYGFRGLYPPRISNLGVNNPYYLGIPGAHPFESDPNRRPVCNVRAWIEMALPLPNQLEGVIDIGWNFQNGGAFQSDLRERTREQYAGWRIEGSVASADLANFDDNNPNSSAQCYIKPEFGQRSAVPPAMLRVGVYDTAGILTARRRGSITMRVPIPPSLRRTIDTVIRQGQNTKEQRWMYNDASLRSINISPVISKGTDWIPESTFTAGRIHTDVKVTAGTTCATYYFSQIALSLVDRGKMIVNIHVFDDFHHAYEALVFELTKYERDITEAVAGLNDLGHFALRTPHSILCMRGNLFIEMTVQSLYSISDAAFVPIYEAMKRLDAYLGRRVVSRNQLRRARLSPLQPLPNLVVDDSAFAVTMASRETLLPMMNIRTSAPSSIIWAKFDNSTFTHTFWALKRADTTYAREYVSIMGAHFDTFHPEAAAWPFVVGRPNSTRRSGGN